MSEELPEINPEQALQVTISGIASNSEKVSAAIDQMSSANLKRVLKTITHTALAEEILTGKKIELDENEAKLVDKIFLLQEDVLGYIQLKQELEGENNEQVD